MTSEILAGFDTASCDAGLDASFLAGLAASTEVVGFIGMELGRSSSGPASLTAHRRDGIEQFVQGFAVVDIGSGQQKASGMPCRSVTRWRLVPGLPRSVGLAPVASPPFGRDGRAVQAGPAPVKPIRLVQKAQQFAVQFVPDSDGSAGPLRRSDRGRGVGTRYRGIRGGASLAGLCAAGYWLAARNLERDDAELGL